VLKVSLNRKLPIHSIVLSVVVSAMLALINIGSSVALDDILSMAVSGVYLSYLMVSILLPRRRLKGDISLYNSNDDDTVNVPGAKLVWGPFHCPEIWGILVNGFTIIYIIIVVFFSFWPSRTNPGVEGMNWSILGVGGSTVLAALYYFVRARKIYTGPVKELSN
jgi:amino acid transporter